MSQKIIELIRSEDSATAVSAVQKTLGQKLLRAISEQATTVAKMTYGTIFEHFGGADEQPQFMNPADNAYAIFFANALKKFGVNGPEDFQDENTKAQFFQYVDNNWKAQDSVQGLAAPAGPMMGQTTGTMVPANATPPMPPTTPAEPVMPGIGAPTNTAPMPPDAMAQDAMPPDASAMPAPAANPGGFQIPPGYTLILHPADQPLPFGGSNDRSVASMSPTGAPATGDGEMDDSGSDPGLDALQAGQTGQNPDDGDDDEDPNLDITDDDMANADSDDEEGAPPSFGKNNQFGDDVNHYGNNDQDGDEDGIPNSEDQDDESVDFDGDGVPDSEDADDDGDGFEDGDGDEDGDGVPDGEDLDADGNGMYDDEEDADGDGVPDRSDADKDGNNVLDADEEDEEDEDGDEDEDVDTDDDGNQFIDDAGVPDGDGDADDMDDSAADEDMDSDEDTSDDEEASDDESDPDLDVTDKDVADLEDAEDDEDGDEDDEDSDDDDDDDEEEDGEPSGEDEFDADVDSDDNFFKESYVIPKPKASKIVNNFPRTEDFGVTVANTEDILFIKECIDPLLAKTPKTDRAGQMKLRNVKKQLRDIRESRTEKLAALRKERAAIMRDLTKTLVEKEEAKFQLARQAKEHMRQCKNQATRVKKQYTGR